MRDGARVLEHPHRPARSDLVFTLIDKSFLVSAPARDDSRTQFEDLFDSPTASNRAFRRRARREPASMRRVRMN